MTLDLKKYVKLFKEEGEEYLQKMEEDLEGLQDETRRGEILREMFRYAHSLKGMAGSLGFAPIQELAHKLEDFLKDVQEKPFQPAYLECIEEGIEYLRHMIQNAPELSGTEQKLVEKFVHKLQSVKQGVTDQAVEVQISETTPPHEHELPVMESIDIPEEALDEVHTKIQGRVLLGENVTLPAARLMVVYKTLEKLGKIKYANPDFDTIKTGKVGNSFLFEIVSKQSPENIQRELITIPDVEKVEIQVVETKHPEGDIVRETGILPTTVRVELEEIDTLFDLASAMFMQIQRIRGTVQEWAKSRLSVEDEILLRDSETIARQLYLHLMNLRMLPVSFLVDPLRRTARMLARSLHKKVKIVTKGEELQIDKAILEYLLDGFIHIIRNSIDHGIEPPDIRVRKGKPPEGYISIHVTQKGEWLIFTILDDGAGMPLDRIVQKALEKGLITPAQLKNMTQEDICMLVTMPGFSTSEKVTQVSGRGVGMDVVRHRVESLGGTLRIETKPDKGTKIVLRVPSRLAILDTFIIRHGPYHLAVPIERVVRVEQYRASRVHLRENVPLWYIGEKLAPIIALERIIHVPIDKALEDRHVLTMEYEEGWFSVIVHEIVSEYRSVVQKLELPLSRIPLFSGITVSPHLEVIPLVDTEFLGRYIHMTVGKAHGS